MIHRENLSICITASLLQTVSTQTDGINIVLKADKQIVRHVKSSSILTLRRKVAGRTYLAHLAYASTGFVQTRRCSSQSILWCSGEQYLTNLHRLHTNPSMRGALGSSTMLPSLPSLLPTTLPSLPPSHKCPDCAISSEKQT